MSHFIDRVMNALRGGRAEHGHEHVGEQEQGTAPEHAAGEAERPGDDNRAGEHGHGPHEGHKHC